VSFDVEFIPGPRALPGEPREIESRVADAWDAAEQAIGESQVEALEAAGMTVTWNARSVSVSIPYTHDSGVSETFDTLIEHVARELDAHLGWIVDDETTSRGRAAD
jgi:hypothetical protein